MLADARAYAKDRAPRLTVVAAAEGSSLRL
jgi:hypothetical protein